MTKQLMGIFLFLILSAATMAAEEMIPLDSIRVPSNDLLFEGRILGMEEAYRLSSDEENPLDLSVLNPVESDLWKNEINHQVNGELDLLPLTTGQKFNYGGAINSHSGLLRFNVLPQNGDNKVYTFLMDKTLHTYLLRKNILRKLGYTVAPMKHISSVVISFKTASDLLFFIKRQVPESTYGAASRWIGTEVMDSIMEKIKKSHEKLVKEGKIDPKIVKLEGAWRNQTVADNADLSLDLELHDVVGMMPTESDHYNPAVMVPPNTYKSRPLRSLIIPYAVTDIYESINKVDWFLGSEDNRHIKLPHYSMADLNPTLDDAKWALRRFAKLTKEDFKDIVDGAAYPQVVAKLVYQKLISRRNAIFKLFKMKFKEWDVDFKVSDGKLLKKGSLRKEEWKGYASRFAHGAPDSPFQDFQYYIFSKLQTESISNLIAKANEKLVAFDLGKVRSEFHKKEFEDGLADYLETGVLKPIKVGTWFSPTANLNLIVNRDIVIGNYMGTDNLVQLADTFGVGFSFGGHLGIENLPFGASGFARGNVSYLKTYTHLKPVKTLKATFKEPYKNIMVPLLKRGLKKRLDALIKFEEGSAELEEEVRKEEFRKLMDHLNKNLGVGESLLISEKVTPAATLGGKYGFVGLQLGANVGTDFVEVSRLHLYRKDSETIQIYDDMGNSRNFDISMSADYYIPVIRFTASDSKGEYNIKAHSVNINSDLEKNPNFYRNANAIFHLLDNGSSELLNEIRKPYQLKGNFHDKSTKMAFLVWRAKYLNGNNITTITKPTGSEFDFLHLTQESQSGINYEAFTKDVMNYYISKFYGDLGIQLGVERFKNPAHTIKGVSESRSNRFESRLSGDAELESENKDIAYPFIGLSIKKEGWSKSTKKIRKIIEKINKKYNKKLFPDETLRDASKLRLFDISLNVNLYENAIERLVNLKKSTLENIQSRYKRERRFSPSCLSNTRLRTNGPRRQLACGNLSTIISLNNSCKKEQLQGNAPEKARCLLKLADKLEQNLEWKDFLEIVGGVNNIYVYGMISGFRKGSELLMDPIRSSSIGLVNGRYPEGAVSAVKRKLGLQGGEFDGKWIRESL